MNWYVEIVDGQTGKIETHMGPMSESKADRVERGALINLNTDRYYVRSYSEDDPPEPFKMPEVGAEFDNEKFAALISGDRPAAMAEANLLFIRNLHSLLKLGGVWGWVSTATIWTKTHTGFRRTA